LLFFPRVSVYFILTKTWDFPNAFAICKLVLCLCLTSFRLRGRVSILELDLAWQSVGLYGTLMDMVCGRFSMIFRFVGIGRSLVYRLPGCSSSVDNVHFHQ